MLVLLFTEVGKIEIRYIDFSALRVVKMYTVSYNVAAPKVALPATIFFSKKRKIMCGSIGTIKETQPSSLINSPPT